MAFNKNKKAAIELSIGTVVIIVLAMSMLILGIILIRNIFSTATTSITEIDQGVKNEINRLFSENQDRVLVLYPDSRIIQVERGTRNSGFAVSLRNTADTDQTIKVKLGTIEAGDCVTTNYNSKLSIIGLSTTEQSYPLGPKRALENPIHIRISADEDSELCTFIVPILITSGPTGSQRADMHVEIVG
jgi:hypothetical protein